MNFSRTQIIQSNPIGTGLDNFRDEFKTTCQKLGLPPSTEILSEINAQDYSHILTRNNIDQEQVDANCIIPLLRDVVNEEPDEILYAKTYVAVTESTPPPRLQAHILHTPYTYNTSSVVDSSEQRQNMDDLLKEEMGPLYIDVPGFYEAFYGKISRLEENAGAVFQKCKEGDVPLYREGTGWSNWPKGAQEMDVLKWFSEQVQLFRNFAEGLISAPATSRGLLTQPSKALKGSTAERKLDIGFVENLNAGRNAPYQWSQVLVPGELKSNPASDMATQTWLDLARYVREVLIAQDTRRFVLGFTLCGATMRLWEFDRVGGIASASFDINKDGARFVSLVLGFLWMDKEQLGFDPTIVESNCRQLAGKLIEKAMSLRLLFVIKDSWQYPECDQKGELLREATEKEVKNMARYYHHETVQVGGIGDDVQTNVRGGLDISKAVNFLSQSQKAESSTLPPTTPVELGSTERDRSFKVASSIKRSKRTSSSINLPIPPRKRTISISPTKKTIRPAFLNRVHRRVIVSDYGKPIYRASSRAAMLGALEGCIKGYQSLHQTGILQRDISIGNLMMNEDLVNPSQPAFWIDLDLTIHTQRERSSGAHGKTGTRAFMAIGVLFGETHLAIHDYESFFWVLFWIYIHYNDPKESGRVVPMFEKWNYMNTGELALMKSGMVVDEGVFWHI
ncbi:hypothetical protein MMC26_005145 [Xylographa opegraphella]|nr:hypothetical protein [Xylographa opegraphella]